METQKLLKLSWEEVAAGIETEISQIIGRPIPCTARTDNWDYWTVNFKPERITLSELELLFCAVNATADDLAETFGEAKKESLNEIGMGVTEKILQRHLGVTWQFRVADENFLYLLNVQYDSEAEPKFQLNEHSICINDLKSMEELLAYLKDNGETHKELMEFCDEYRDRYQNELCWQYPITDGEHLGTYLVIVKEGILSLPYDESYGEDYEQFRIEDAVLIDGIKMAELLEDWKNYSASLTAVLTEMQSFLERKEAHDEKRS